MLWRSLWFMLGAMLRGSTTRGGSGMRGWSGVLRREVVRRGSSVPKRRGIACH